MPDLIISTEFSKVVFNNQAQIYITNNLFGDVLFELEKEYPKLPFESESLLNDAFSKSSFTLWGMKGSNIALHSMLELIDNRSQFSLSFQEAEELRLRYHFNSYQRYDGSISYKNKNAIIFSDLKSITQVLSAVLYYYSLHNLKLNRCEHCGRWFATTSYKNKYCTRKSLFEGYTHLNCEQAVRNIKQEINREKKRVYNRIASYSIKNYGENPSNVFLDECLAYKLKLDEQSSVENLSLYWNFLKNYKVGENNGNDK